MLNFDKVAGDGAGSFAPVMDALDALDQGLLLLESGEDGRDILRAWNGAASRCLQLADGDMRLDAEGPLSELLALHAAWEDASVRLASGRLVRLVRRRRPDGGSLVVCSDITLSAGATAEAPDAESQDRAVLESTPAGILCVTPDGIVDYANPAALNLFDASIEDLVVADRLLPSDDRPLTWHLANTRRFEARISAPYFDRHVMVSVSRLASGRIGPTRILSLTDITPLKQANNRIEFLAKHDPLTGLGNRMQLKAVWDVVEPRIVAESFPVHAIALDLDHFKQVNDVHGHAVGDELLRQVAQRLRAATKGAPHLFRFGGDEFFVLLEGVSRHEAIEIAERIVGQIRDAFEVHGHAVRIGCSAGVASAPLDGLSRDQIHRAADLALYEVKRQGRNGVACFDPAHEQALLERRLIQTDLALAIANESFHLVFQPQVEAGTQRIFGVEALLRWENRRLARLVPPSEFIPLAEQAGLVHLIDIWMIRNAVAQFARLKAAGWAGSSLSINLSALTLMQEDIPALLERALALHHVPGECIEIEISERVVAVQGQDLVKAVARLRELGVRVAIDDFCAGRGDFGFLTALSVGRLKLDHSIVQKIGAREDTLPLIASIWDLCQRLGLKMTAEGIESEDQWAALQGVGAVHGQGFHLGMPEEIAAMLQRLATEPAHRQG